MQKWRKNNQTTGEKNQKKPKTKQPSDEIQKSNYQQKNNNVSMNKEVITLTEKIKSLKYLSLQ